jgi:hypothetical protein
VAATRAHGTRARYVWGPDENGQPGGCRCRACTEVRRVTEAQRKRLIAYGQWQPFVDAGPAREHVRALARCGIGWKRAAALAGVPNGSMSRLMFGTSTRAPSKRIRPETERRILAVRPSPEALSPGHPVDATATRRRVQALVAVGYSRTFVAGRLGRTGANFLTTLSRQQVTAATALAVRALYDELWDVPPPELDRWARSSVARAKNMARANRWPPPQAWDDETIGDPDAKPAEGWQRRGHLSRAEVAEEAAELIGWGLSRADAAQRLGKSRDALDKVFERAGKAS